MCAGFEFLDSAKVEPILTGLVSRGVLRQVAIASASEGITIAPCHCRWRFSLAPQISCLSVPTKLVRAEWGEGVLNGALLSTRMAVTSGVVCFLLRGAERPEIIRRPGRASWGVGRGGVSLDALFLISFFFFMLRQIVW